MGVDRGWMNNLNLVARKGLFKFPRLRLFWWPQ